MGYLLPVRQRSGRISLGSGPMNRRTVADAASSSGWWGSWGIVVLFVGLFFPVGPLVHAQSQTRPMNSAPSTTQSSVPRPLHAGPISLKFEDGELRYLYVGQKEIVRRVYFAVRDGSWNTAMPRFTNVAVDDGG